MEILIPNSYPFSIVIVLLPLNAAAQDERPLLEEIIVTAEKRSESLQELDQADSISARARLLRAPTDNLRFNFTAQYYDENTNGAAQKGILDPTPGGRKLAQDWDNSYELAKTPNFTADVMLRYRGRLSSWGDFEGSVQYIYRDGFQHRIFNNPKTDDVPSYDVVNLMLTITPDAYPCYVDLMAMNLGDEDGINARFTDVFGVGATGDELIAPRQYTVRFGMEF